MIKYKKYQTAGKIEEEKAFLKNWYNNPETKKRLENNLKTYPHPKFKDADSFLENINSNLDTVKTFYNENPGDILGNLIKFYSEKHPDYNKETIEQLAINNFKTNAGFYDDETHSVIINRPIEYNPSVPSHEYTHATGADDYFKNLQENSEKFNKINNDFKNRYGTSIKHNANENLIELTSDFTDENLQRNKSELTRVYGKKFADNILASQKLKEMGVNIEELNYINNSKEVYPRLMSIRKMGKLVPGQIVTKEMLQEIKNKMPEEKIFNYYSLEQLLKMLNSFAHVNNNNVMTGKYGGKINPIKHESGGIIGSETFNVGNTGNREVKGSINNKGKIVRTKKSNKVIVTAGQLRQTGVAVKAQYGMTLDNYIDKVKEEDPNVKLTITPGKWLINPDNDKKFNLMVQSSNTDVNFKNLQNAQNTYDEAINNFKMSIGNPDEPNIDYWINSLIVPEAAKLKKQYPDDNLNFEKALKMSYDKIKYSQNTKGKDIATTHNNPGNIKYGEFAAKYGAVPGKKATDGGVFALFPSIEAGEQARMALLRYGKNYRNLTVNEALKRWSNNGYNGNIVPHLANRKISSLTDEEFRILSAAQIKNESKSMFQKLNKHYAKK